MDNSGEAEKIRIDDNLWTDEETREDKQGDGGAIALVCKTIKISTYPRVAMSYYGLKPTAIFGAETEGIAGTSSPYGKVFLGANLGNAIPPEGTEVIARFIQNRWTFRYGG